MESNYLQYWKDCISSAAEECGLALTDDQLLCLAEGAEGGHECIGQAFYSPPPSDRMNQIERDHKASIAKLQREHEQYVMNAEAAVTRALGLARGSQVSIKDRGEVMLIGGRSERIL